MWRGALYYNNYGNVQRLDWQGNIWRTNALPISIGCEFYNLNGRLYAANYDSIQQITEDARGTRLLASIQRRPAVTSLDSQGALRNLALFTDDQNILCAATHNKVYRWDDVDWREIGEAPASSQPLVFEDGVLFMTDGYNSPGQISCFDTRNKIVETCLFPASQIPSLTPLPDVLPKPLWKLPKELLSQPVSVAYWQSNLLMMSDHSEEHDIVAEEHGSLADGTLETNQIITGREFLPKDGYNSALYRFSRGRAAAGKVLLKFDNPEGCPPMAGVRSDSNPWMTQIVTSASWMIFTPKYLICARDAVPGRSESDSFKLGVWVVPLDSIMPKFPSLKQAQSDQNSAK